MSPSLAATMEVSSSHFSYLLLVCNTQYISMKTFSSPIIWLLLQNHFVFVCRSLVLIYLWTKICKGFSDGPITQILIICICRYCPCFSGGGYCSERCGCLPCFNKVDFAETVQTTRKVLLSRQKRMSMKINRRLEANAETVVVFLTQLDHVAVF
jgi:hypothetical protein